jgi:hypothetical protein
MPPLDRDRPPAPEPHVTKKIEAVLSHAPHTDPRMDPGTTSPDVEHTAPEHDFAAGFSYLAGLINNGNRQTSELAARIEEQHFENVQRFRRLEKKVFGDKLPPLLPGSLAGGSVAPRAGSSPSISMPSLPPMQTVSSPPLTQATLEHGGKIDALQGDVGELREELAAVRAMNAQQSRGLGLVPKTAESPDPPVAKKVVTFLFSAPGFVALASLIAALTGLVAAFRGAPPVPVPSPVVTAPAAR